MNTKDDQIIALLTHQAYSYATEILCTKSLSNGSYLEVFGVTLADIISYVDINGFPDKSYKSEEDNGDGIYFIKKADDWHLYYKERNIVFTDEYIHDFKEAKLKLIKTILNLSGTGIQFQ